VLGAVAGAGVKSLVPDHLVQLNGRDIEIQLYPSDVALAGKEVVVNRSRAAMASRLASTSAFMTTSEEAQAVEEKLQGIAHRGHIDERTQLDLLAIDDRLAHLEVPYEEWEVLYRQRLQIERDLLTGRTPGAVPGEAPGTARPPVLGPDAPPPAGGRLAIEAVLAVGAVVLLVLDVVLAVRDRRR
jgi:hypothetical protein